MINIFMDDLRNCPDHFTVYRTAEELLSDIRHGKIRSIDILSLDHDMGLDDNGELIMNGSKFIVRLIEQLIEQPITIRRIQFHTSNTVGFEYMSSTLRQAQKRGFISNNIVVDTRLTNYIKWMKEG